MTTETPVSSPAPSPLVAKILQYVAPFVAIVVGAVSSWLFVRLHALGFLNITQDQTAKTVAGLVMFTLTAVLTWLSHQAFVNKLIADIEDISGKKLHGQ